MNRPVKLDYKVIVAAVNGNMAATGFILEQYRWHIDEEIYHYACHLPKEVRKECHQEVCIELIRLIQHKFKL